MSSAYRVDLHTHSVASNDGGITPSQYEEALRSGLLDCVAITDHGRVDLALQLQQRFGNHIIVGEEIMTLEGELIGLYLTSAVPNGLSPLETIRAIHDQGGLVYVPHPFETIRSGLHPVVLDELLGDIDMVEVCNGRAFLQDRSAQVVLYTRLNKIISVAASDAHGVRGLGKTYTLLNEMPDRDSLLNLLKNGTLMTDRPDLRSLLYPKLNKLKKKLKT